MNETPTPQTTSTTLMPRRLEYKFLTPESLLPVLRLRLAPYVVLDRFAQSRPQRHYTVRSIYYDTLNLASYQEKIEGFANKRKLRVRGYDLPEPDSIVFLEIKRREEDFISKSRAPVRWDQLGKVLPLSRQPHTPWIFLANSQAETAARRFLYHFKRGQMVPTALIAYEREAFFGRFDSRLRLTFDRNVRSRLFPSLATLYQDRDAVPVMPGYFVFEVKFYGRLPYWIQTTVSRLGLVRMAISKYARGIDCQHLAWKLYRSAGHVTDSCQSCGHGLASDSFSLGQTAQTIIPLPPPPSPSACFTEPGKD